MRLIIFCTAASLLVAWMVILLGRKSFYKGVSIDGYDVSGLDTAKAKDLVYNRLSKLYENQNIILKFGENSYALGLKDISYTFLIDEALQNAYKAGHSGNIFERLLKIAGMVFKQSDYEIKADFNRENMRNILQDIKKHVDVEARSATVEYKKDKVVISKETVGRYLYIDLNLKIVEENLINKNIKDISLNIEEKRPAYIYDDLKEITSVLASFSTSFNLDDANRSYNIKLACETINKTVIMPKGVFSMNNALGPRTSENGYLEAPVIYKSELVKGTGGGVCQVTTTLYDAVLKSKLDIIERTHHSMTLAYVEPGQDATIAEGSIDFKFQNNKDYPVGISAAVTENKLIIRILGKKDPEENVVKLVSKVLKEYYPEGEDVKIDEIVPDYQKITVTKARKGVKVAVYRETYSKDGKLLGSEKISEDVYKPVKAVVKVNKNYYNAQETVMKIIDGSFYQR